MVVGVALARRVRVRRAESRRADPAARALPEPDVHGHERDRLHRRPRPLRRGHVSPALPADRQGLQPDRVRVAADADDGGRARHVDRQRAADQPARPLQAVPDRRHRADDGRDVPALGDQRLDADLADRSLHARARVRARDDDAGARARGSERGPVRAARRRHLRARRCSGRSAARSASRSSARSSPTSSPATSPTRCRRERSFRTRSARTSSRSCRRRFTRSTSTRSPRRSGRCSASRRRSRWSASC